MSFLDKILDTMKLNEDFDDDDFLDDDLDAEFEDEKPKKRFFKKLEEDDDFDDFDDDISYRKPEKASAKSAKQPKSSKAASSKVTPMRTTKKGTGNMEVCVIKPSTMEDTREIVDTLVDGCTVVLNLEGLDMEIAQRIIDFTSGACYSLNGSLQKVSSYIFILTPANVDITGDYQQILNGAVDVVSTARSSF